MTTHLLLIYQSEASDIEESMDGSLWETRTKSEGRVSIQGIDDLSLLISGAATRSVSVVYYFPLEWAWRFPVLSAVVWFRVINGNRAVEMNALEVGWICSSQWNVAWFSYSRCWINVSSWAVTSSSERNTWAVVSEGRWGAGNDRSLLGNAVTILLVSWTTLAATTEIVRSDAWCSVKEPVELQHTAVSAEVQ